MNDTSQGSHRVNNGRVPMRIATRSALGGVLVVLLALSPLSTPAATSAGEPFSLPGSDWTIPAPKQASGLAITTGGEAVVGRCWDGPDPASKALSYVTASGASLWQIDAEYACPVAVDAAGNTYVSVLDASGHHIEARDPAGMLRWTSTRPEHSVRAATVAPNGVLYVQQYTGRTAEPVLGFDTGTGELVFNHTFDDAYALYSYDDGLILQSDHDVKYIGYDGSLRHEYGLSEFGLFESDQGMNGDIYIAAMRWADETVQGARNVAIKVTPTGIDWIWQEAELHGRPVIAATPDGGAVLFDAASAGGANAFGLTGDGVLEWTRHIPDSPDHGTRVIGASSDTNGVVALTYTVDTPCEYDSAQTCSGLRTQFLSQNGAGPGIESINTASPTGIALGVNPAPRFAPGHVYMLVDNGSNDFSVSLASFPAPGLAMDYQLALATGSGSTPPPPNEPPCGDAAIIGVRGSGDNNNGRDYPGRHALAIAKLLRDRASLDLYDRGDSTPRNHVIGLRYPAVSVTNSEVRHYRGSVRTGVRRLHETIESIRSECGNALPILLVGYSQGADVVQSTLEELAEAASGGDRNWTSIRGVVLLASPRFKPNDRVARGTYPASYPLSGIRPGAAAVVPYRFQSTTRSYCLRNDPVCQFSPSNLANHTSTHTHSYDIRTATGAAIASDAVGLLRWGIRTSEVPGPSAAPFGGLKVTGSKVDGNRAIVSAAAVYSKGAPSVRFDWDFNNDGEVDQRTRKPWVSHKYGFRLDSPLPGAGPKRVRAAVRIAFSDQSTKRLTICIRFGKTGPTAC